MHTLTGAYTLTGAHMHTLTGAHILTGAHMHTLTGAHTRIPPQEPKHQGDVGKAFKGTDGVFRKETQIFVRVLFNYLTKYQV